MKRAFTLVEVMIVVVIVAFLASIVITTIMEIRKHDKNKSESTCISFVNNNVSVNLNKYDVKFLFEVDGVKMYRFYDQEAYGEGFKYFTVFKNPKVTDSTTVLEKETKSR
jgi:prepilin-type N-terminal cleavage/methylation domain-containing protein